MIPPLAEYVPSVSSIKGYLLPPGLDPPSVRTISFGQLRIDTIDGPPAFYRHVIDRLRAAHTMLRGIAIDELITILANAAARWRDPTCSPRRTAITWLSHLTGSASAMIEEGIDHLFGQMDVEQLSRLVTDGTGHGMPGRQRRLSGGTLEGRYAAVRTPTVTLLIVAGNVPGLIVTDLAAILLARSACLIRPASRDMVIPLLFAQMLAEMDTRLAAAMAVVWWPKDDDTIGAQLCAAADCVVASGSDETLATLKPLTRRLIGYGHRVSVALIGAESLEEADDLAGRAARDICWYEQQGCLSPHLLFIQEGGVISPRAFADRLAHAMEAQTRRWPAAPVPLEVAGRIVQLRGELEFRRSSGAAVLTPGSEGAVNAERRSCLDWTVLYDPDPTPRTSPGYRTIWVKPIRDLHAAVEQLNTWRGTIESVGIASSPHDDAQFAHALTLLGVSRFCSLGTMQQPPLGWRRGGHSLLQMLLTEPHS